LVTVSALGEIPEFELAVRGTISSASSVAMRLVKSSVMPLALSDRRPPSAEHSADSREQFLHVDGLVM
jgi:hypothetical protein